MKEIGIEKFLTPEQIKYNRRQRAISAVWPVFRFLIPRPICTGQNSCRSIILPYLRFISGTDNLKTGVEMMQAVERSLYMRMMTGV